MENLDIKNFTQVTGVSTGDYILLATSEGKDGKLVLSALLKYIQDNVTPEIAANGKWYIGDTPTNIEAKGKSPEFKKGDATTAAVLWRYEGDTEWMPLVEWDSIKVNASELTTEQLLSLKLSYSDLTDEDKADLRSVFNDIIATCQEKTSEAETQADEARQAASRANTAADKLEDNATYAKEQGDYAATQGKKAEQAVENIENNLDELFNKRIVVLTQDEYDDLLVKKKDVLYFCYE